MFDYPNTMSLSELQTTSSEYALLYPVWQEIDDLAVGGHQIKQQASKYLKPRPNENPPDYQKRLSKFTYANILGMAIREQVSKLNLGSLVVLHQNDDQFWGDFLAKVDGDDQHDSDFVTDIFRVLLKFSKAYVRIDNPQFPQQLITNQQAISLGIQPFLELIDPRNVLIYNQDQNDPWIKIRIFKEINTRSGSEKLLEGNWIFIDSEQIAHYQAVGKLSDITYKDINNPNSLMYQREYNYSQVFSENISLLNPPIKHRFGQIPIVQFSLQEDLWLVNQAYLLQIEHLNLHNSKYDTSMMIGYVQRTWKPITATTPDLDYTYTNEKTDVPEILSGNQYILKVDDFKFSEAVGTSVTVVSDDLDKLENKIRDIVGLSGLSASKGNLEQSGVSKLFDTVVQEIVLREYGKILTQSFTKVLKLVAIAGGKNPDNVYATGLNNFNLNSLQELAEIASLLEPNESKIAPTALKLFYSYLQGAMAKNANPEQENQIMAETETIWMELNS